MGDKSFTPSTVRIIQPHSFKVFNILPIYGTNEDSKHTEHEHKVTLQTGSCDHFLYSATPPSLQKW